MASSYSWTVGNVNTTYDDLRNPGDDVEATMYQATDILRRRTTLSLTGRESPALRDEIADLLPEPRQVESEPQAVVGIVSLW